MVELVVVVVDSVVVVVVDSVVVTVVDGGCWPQIHFLGQNCQNDFNGSFGSSHATSLQISLSSTNEAQS